MVQVIKPSKIKSGSLAQQHYENVLSEIAEKMGYTRSASAMSAKDVYKQLAAEWSYLRRSGHSPKQAARIVSGLLKTSFRKYPASDQEKLARIGERLAKLAQVVDQPNRSTTSDPEVNPNAKNVAPKQSLPERYQECVRRCRDEFKITDPKSVARICDLVTEGVTPNSEGTVGAGRNKRAVLKQNSQVIPKNNTIQSANFTNATPSEEPYWLKQMQGGIAGVFERKRILKHANINRVEQQRIKSASAGKPAWLVTLEHTKNKANVI
jgi:hypothetical protein